MERTGFGDGARANSRGPLFETRDYTDPLNATVLSKLQAEALLGLSSPGTSHAIETRMSQRDDQVRLTNQASSGTHYTTLLRSLASQHTRASNVIAPEILSGFEIVSNRHGHTSTERADIKLSFNRLNELVDPGTGRLSAAFIDGTGPVRSLQPGRSETKLNRHFREERDSEGYVIKHTETLASGPNCTAPFSGRSQCTYVLRDRAIAKALGVKGDSVALSVTIDEETKRDRQRKIMARLLDIDIRVRSLDGQNMAEVDQQVTLNAKGSIQYVSTRARRPI
ncbi:MAG: hypothetical protein SFV17_21245 [Candidatus Obscuribacter sp.]|nr:hypothetical protein [Candidatus Obscuribacter sp.]